MPNTPNGHTLYQRVMADTPGGDSLITCLQCGTCGGSCPSAADMDSTPRRLFAMLMAGMDDEVLKSNTPWYCVSCYYCTVRCPQNIPITEIMYTLKQEAIARKYYDRNPHTDWANSFIGYVEQYGRGFEFGLATRYHLTHNPLGAVKKTGLMFDLARKGRVAMTPERIENMPQLTAILTEAKRIAGGEQ
ncbi:MAG: 4Fe-4S dicluster domain-containing protein [Anaerolineaceae bacterium]|nr:4Fe-4S dicluster domain-containing protein [Anaerolineaceae bacterium]